VIAVDLNLLLYAHNRAAPQHAAARDWWQERMNGDALVGLPEPVVFGFLRITTQRGILSEPLPTERALSIVRGWLEWPRVRVLYGTAGSLARPRTSRLPRWRSNTAPRSPAPTPISPACPASSGSIRCGLEG
jgi:toxin-antitoxin system PIN domain toxin